MIRLVYIAGPFRGSHAWEIECNIRRAETLALGVARMPGLFPVCPHTMGRYYSGAAPDEVWLEGDLELLRRCDAVLLVPGWERSSGTRAEVAEAHRLSIPVFEAIMASEDIYPGECQRLRPGDARPRINETLAMWQPSVRATGTEVAS